MERGLRLVDHNNLWYRVITTNVARMAEYGADWKINGRVSDSAIASLQIFCSQS